MFSWFGWCFDNLRTDNGVEENGIFVDGLLRVEAKEEE
jgi:hypothetical protein